MVQFKLSVNFCNYCCHFCLHSFPESHDDGSFTRIDLNDEELLDLYALEQLHMKPWHYYVEGYSSYAAVDLDTMLYGRGAYNVDDDMRTGHRDGSVCRPVVQIEPEDYNGQWLSGIDFNINCPGPITMSHQTLRIKQWFPCLKILLKTAGQSLAYFI